MKLFFLLQLFVTNIIVTIAFPSPPDDHILNKWDNYTGQQQIVSPGCRPKRNFVFMVSDGFGTASETLAREFLQYKTMQNDTLSIHDINSILPLDDSLVGAVRTKSSSSWVTDSASAATAMATGHKTYNAGIGINPKGVPVASVLEAAKYNGYTTALVTTSRITHATPASWSSHVGDRDQEDIIATQQIGDNPLNRSIDLMFGGGRSYFLPKSNNGSTRQDERNLITEAIENYGWNTYIETRNDLIYLNKTKHTLPIMGLFALNHIDYEIDRNPNEQPSISEMTNIALTILANATSECNSPGFFIIIEGARIDQAAHSNDAPTHIHEILAYQHAVNIVKHFVKIHPNTGAISVSDHETGALSVGWQVDRLIDQMISSYQWLPSIISPVTMSVEKLSTLILNYNGNNIIGYIRQLITDKWNFNDVSDEEISDIIQSRHDQLTNRYPGYVFPIEIYLSKLSSKRAFIGWNTNGHTGMDVNLYAFNAPGLSGNVDNTYLARYSADYLSDNIWNTVNKLTPLLASLKIDIPVEYQ